jgi:hypothetical protein
MHRLEPAARRLCMPTLQIGWLYFRVVACDECLGKSMTFNVVCQLQSWWVPRVRWVARTEAGGNVWMGPMECIFCFFVFVVFHVVFVCSLGSTCHT